MTIRVFVSGQSNALGRGSGGPAWSAIDSRVRVWDNVNPLGTNGSAWRTAAIARSTYSTFENADRNNAAVWFCSRLAAYANDNIDMTIVARGGTLISGWAPGGGVGMLEECLAVYAATGQAPAHVFVWQQGESNATTAVNTYRDAFLELLSSLQSSGVIDANTLVILGGTPEDSEDRVSFNRNTYAAIMAADSRCVIARSDGLQTYDNLHFTGDALYTLGTLRMIDAYVKGKTSMVALWALVNEGGTPGTAGSGADKIVDLEKLLKTGYRPKGPPIYMTSNQTYNRPSDVAAVHVIVQAPGGGGAGARGDDGTARVGGGGGVGAKLEVTILNPLNSYPVSIGAFGTGGAAGPNNGTPGGSASFGVFSANGGGAGTTFSATTALIIASPGAGASAPTSGDLNVGGASGGLGIKLSIDVRLAGSGGNSTLGSGGRGFNASTAVATANGGLAGDGYGSGGGGGCSSSSANAAGGNGAPGVVIVQEFIRG